MASLEEIRKKLQNMSNRGSNNGGSNDTTLFKHWDLPEGGSAKIRFLPDKDDTNTFFWVEKQVIKLPFAGVIGKPDMKNVVVTVPCADMWEPKSCPIIRETTPWWNDKSLEDLARTYWKSRTYFMQGFVLESDHKEDQGSPNTIRKFNISSQIFKIIKASLLDPEMENLPTDYDNGTNFTINKTKKGQYADYSTSAWARRESALSDDQRQAIVDQGLFDLASFLPKRPGEEELAAIMEMFTASVNGELYDPSRWSKFYKPWGLDDAGTSESADKPAKVQVPVAKVSESDASIPFDVEPAQEKESAVIASSKTTVEAPATPAAPAAGTSAADILARLRNRGTSA